MDGVPKVVVLGIDYAEKKLPSWKNFGLFGPFFWQKLGTWVLLSSVRVTKKILVHAAKTSDLKLRTSEQNNLRNLVRLILPTVKAGA